MSILIFNNGKLNKSRVGGGSYNGSKDMGDLQNWRILTSDSNAILSGSYDTLVDRSATLYHTYGPVKGAINKHTDYGVGPGLVFRSQPDFKTLGWDKDRAVQWGKDFQKIVHMYFQRFSFYEKQSVLFRTALFGGDSFLHFERHAGEISDLIEFGNNQINSNYNKDNYTLGIKHDPWLRREGVMKYDGKEISFIDSAGDQQLIQFYIKQLARQLRGYPLAYSIINLARNDDTHWDAITHRAVMESIMMGLFKSDGTNFPKQAKDMARSNKLKKGQSTEPGVLSKIGNAMRLGAGNMFVAGTSESMEFSKLETPSNNFGEFKDYILKYVGMATNTPPEVMMSEYSTSFTAHKGALNDFIKAYSSERKTFERTVMNPVVKEIAKDAIMNGYIKAPGFFDGNWMIQQAYLSGMYLGPVPGHINPLVEVKAQEQAVKAAFQLRSDVSAMYGNEWDSFVNEWAGEQIEYTNIPQESKAQEVFEQEVENSEKKDDAENSDSKGDNKND